MSAIRKIRRINKRASKFQYSATYQSVVVECQNNKWKPNVVCVAWHRRGRRILSKNWPWLSSPDKNTKGMVVWPEPECVEATITLYKGPNDKSYEDKEWDFSVINIDEMGHRKVLATTSVNMARYASALPFEYELNLKLRPVSRKIKKVMLELNMSSVFLKEGKATDDDMISLASMMSVSNLSTICNLEDDEEYNSIWDTGRSISPQQMMSTEQLIDWAQEITSGYSGVKILNMTTSWKNGLAFCAIIHHFRPDLLDFNDLSSQSIKENNRLAFFLAGELGIACSLTPNMMLLSDIPDKLAVTSFIYQMYNYFTKAERSAITRDESLAGQAESCTSPFNLSQFEELLPPVSPDSTTTHHFAMEKYSRHSREETQSVPVETVTVPVQAPILEPLESESTLKTVQTSENSSENLSVLSHHENLPAVTIVENGSVSSTDPKHETANLPKHETANLPKHETADLPKHETTSESESHHSPISEHKNVVVVESPQHEESKQHTAAAPPPQTFQYVPAASPRTNRGGKGSANSTPAEGVADKQSADSHGNNNHRPLSASLSGSSKSSPNLHGDKKNALKQQAQALLKNHGINSNTLKRDGNISSSTLKRLETRGDAPMLRRKSETQLTSPSRDLKRPVLSTSALHSTLPSVSASANNINQTEPVVTERGKQQAEPDKRQTQQHKDDDKQAISRTTSDSSVLKKPKTNSATYQRLVPKAPSSNPSSDLLEIAKKKPKKKRTKGTKQKSEVAVQEVEKVKEKQTEEKPEHNKEQESSVKPPRPDGGILPDSVTDSGESVNRSPAAPPQESPSTWTYASEDLTKEILKSESEYVRTELTALQQQLHQLEERARSIEMDIRDAMAKDDTSQEEHLMQEHFKLLNKKNRIVKRQIELNLLEKQEDLEKRQFFINRELRPLLQIPEGQKTGTQKTREEQLLQELLKLIDERERLDKRLTTTTRQSASPVAEDIPAASPRRTSSPPVLGIKQRSGTASDCVIS